MKAGGENRVQPYCRANINGDEGVLIPGGATGCENREETVSKIEMEGQVFKVFQGKPLCPSRNSRLLLLGYWRYQSAKSVYDLGMEAFENGRLVEAECHFRDVMETRPYSKYAAYSQLRLADVSLAHGRECEAITRYWEFRAKHPHHPEVLNCYVTDQLILAQGQLGAKMVAESMGSPAK